MIRKRRGSGEGMIRHRSDGRWEGRIDLGWHDGKRHRKSLFAKTRGELQEIMTKALRERDTGTLPARGASPTVGRFLADWLISVRPAVRVRSYEAYEGIVRRHIAADLGRIRIEKLTPTHVQRLLAAKLAAGLSPRTVNGIRMVLQKALGQAMRFELVPRNVATLVDGAAVPHSEMKVLTPEQAALFLESCRGEPLEALYWIALAHGLRRGELLALKWADIDIERGTLSVQRTLGRAKGGIVIDAPKTAKGRRAIQLAAPVVAALRTHRRRQLEKRLAAGPDWRESDWVFATGIGTTLDPRNLANDFTRMLVKAALHRIRFHDLRHSAATIALSLNVHPKVVSEMLGHAKISITLDTYSHALPSMQADAAVRMGDILSGHR